MNIKRFIADSNQEALRLIKREMGPDAVILKTRTLSSREDAAGHTQRRVEVTAAVDYDAPDFGEDSASSVPSITQEALLKRWQSLETELRDIKSAILSAEAGRRLAPELYFNPATRSLYSYFHAFGLRPEIVDDLMTEAHRNSDGRSREGVDILRESLSRLLTRIEISTRGQQVGKKGIYAFIGPTGVGKTTTLAKMAALRAVKEGIRTALITLDTFRIAAVSQLQTYARIMDVPLEVASGKHELNQALLRYRDADLILIDTAGRSPNHAREIRELGHVIEGRDDIHPFLVLSATTDYGNLVSTARQFGKLSYKSTIFTKLDEVQDISAMVNFLVSDSRPVSFFTTGQRVPEDMERASRKRLARLMLDAVKDKAGTLNDSDEVAAYGSGNRPQVLGRGSNGRS
jgi:flagellar biosynthesis protein FlhF